ncbi:DEAD/DEAH box helicase [Alkalihalobacillus trypoxylicola]|uniref:RNA helicase n=1 Tax=Alkalihalobacillus trypoxylicola TaxID=519424 RepID=A0A162ER07_9BACI|nr:DEAD/DEAH box helicase [Alkalihalobacillus trypoxylicola]KYG33509.1 RNA helicase [Alkalihalobacillus trypoxylicola]
MKTFFQEMPLAESIWTQLEKMDIEEPTDIQKQMIPEAMSGQDIVARSQTGTGKTLAFLLPILSKVNSEKKGLQAIIIAPSQELAMQIMDVLKKLTENYPIKHASLIGGANVKRQLERLKKEKPQIAVGTPGRILELLQLKKLKVHEVEIVAVDEADRMVDEQSAWEDFTKIAQRVGREAQYLFVSATIPTNFKEMVADFAPFIVSLEAEGGLLVQEISHLYLKVTERERIDLTRKLIHAEHIKKGIVFVNQIERLNEVVEKLAYRKIEVAPLSSEQSKIEREKAIKQFKEGTVHILVATDVASRGLDIDDVTHIIQLEAASHSNSYLHRAGRTGRMGKAGKVISLISDKDEYKLQKYSRDLKVEMNLVTLEKGQLKINKEATK